MDEKKGPGGRPIKYKPEYCEMLVKHMEAGYSFEAFTGVVDVCKQTLYNWLDKHPEFLDAKKRAWGKSLLFWEKIGIDGCFKQVFKTDDGTETQTINPVVWIFNMKNRFNWKDNVTQETNVSFTPPVYKKHGD